VSHKWPQAAPQVAQFHSLETESCRSFFEERHTLVSLDKTGCVLPAKEAYESQQPPPPLPPYSHPLQGRITQALIILSLNGDTGAADTEDGYAGAADIAAADIAADSTAADSTAADSTAADTTTAAAAPVPTSSVHCPLCQNVPC